MPTTLTKSRIKAFNLQQGHFIYCELPMWSDDPEVFAKKYKITIKQAKPFQCTAEHLRTKQDGGKDAESNIVAACFYCNQKRHKCKSPKDPIPYKQYVTNRLEKGKWNMCMMNKHLNYSKKMPTQKNTFTPKATHSKTSTADRVRFGDRQ